MNIDTTAISPVFVLHLKKKKKSLSSEKILVHQNEEVLWRKPIEVKMNSIFLFQEKLHVLPLFQQVKVR